MNLYELIRNFMNKEKHSLLFVSPRFLFPADTGGAIRTTQILRGMKNGRFEITLVSPTEGKDPEKYVKNIESVCDRFHSWNSCNYGIRFNLKRTMLFFSKYPVPVMSDRSTEGRDLIQNELAKKHDLVIFDFAHSVILAPEILQIPSVLFTHNVETEIFKRHAEVTKSYTMKYIWKSQYKKMYKFESDVIKRFDSVVVVSDRDGNELRKLSDVKNIYTIPTGVDLAHFEYRSPGTEPHIVFSGSMDWLANIDGIEYLMEEVWPLISQAVPEARMTVVGRNPPPRLVAKSKSRNLPWTFTGFVDDIREYVQGAAAYVIPLRVGGGTRMKAFEAMAMGSPVVSTSIGIEGLPLEEGSHYLRADNPITFSNSVVRLLNDKDFSKWLSKQAREYIVRNFSYEKAASVFEDICYKTTFCNQSYE